MPKRQQTVKVEPLDRLHRAPFLDAAGERGEADRLEHRDRGGMQERQVAEPVAQPIVAHRRLRVDVLFLRQPGDRGLLVAELVDQLELDRPGGR